MHIKTSTRLLLIIALLSLLAPYFSFCSGVELLLGTPEALLPYLHGPMPNPYLWVAAALEALALVCAFLARRPKSKLLLDAGVVCLCAIAGLVLFQARLHVFYASLGNFFEDGSLLSIESYWGRTTAFISLAAACFTAFLAYAMEPKEADPSAAPDAAAPGFKWPGREKIAGLIVFALLAAAVAGSGYLAYSFTHRLYDRSWECSLNRSYYLPDRLYFSSSGVVRGPDPKTPYEFDEQTDTIFLDSLALPYGGRWRLTFSFTDWLKNPNRLTITDISGGSATYRSY